MAKIDFSYAFVLPHRLTVCRSNSSDKTILDVYNDRLRMAWSYDDLTSSPLSAWKAPSTNWEVWFTPKVEGQAYAKASWMRREGFLPILVNRYMDHRGLIELEVTGTTTAAVVRAVIENTGERVCNFSLKCGTEQPVGAGGYNPHWVDALEDPDVLLAGWRDRADRLLLFAVGTDGATAASNSFELHWSLHPGEKREAWIIRPYRAYACDLSQLRAVDWKRETLLAQEEWHALLQRASRVHIPDTTVEHAFLACLADLYVMREPMAGGYLAAIPGTEVYRSTSPFEPLIVTVAQDLLGLHDDAVIGQQLFLDLQEEDGNWTEPRGWTHLMWGSAGIKAWAIMEHYKLTGDRAYLETMYPRMLASSRWQETMRSRTRVLVDGRRTPDYGLMPRGMGDAGLMNGDDFYGVFYPHNIWSIFADKLTLEAATILGRHDDVDEAQSIFETAYTDFLLSLQEGAIQEDDYRWIPGTPGKTSGSRWGVLNALFPCRLLPPDHKFISGTIRRIESQQSPGGIPINTGWLKNGMWISAVLDDVAQVHLVRGNGDAAIAYLYAALNHGTPLFTWCEERGQEPGSETCTGDRQHLWTPLSIVRLLRNCLVMEGEEGLELGKGISRHWLLTEKTVGIHDARTHFGTVSYEMQLKGDRNMVTGTIQLVADRRGGPQWIDLHVRLPYSFLIGEVTCRGADACVIPENVVRLQSLSNALSFDIHLDNVRNGEQHLLR